MELGALIIHHKPFSELILKRILLLFDYVCIVNPEQNEQLIPRGTPQVDFHVLKYDREYAYFYKGRSYSATENELLYKYNKLIDEGLVRVLNLVDDGFYLHNWLPLRLSFDYDTANPEFAKLFKPLFENQPVIQPGDTVLPGCIVRDEMINLFMPNSYPKLPSPTVIYDADDEYDVGNFHDHQLYSVIGRLNKLVMVSSEYNLVSVFLDNNIVNGFNEKFRIAKANNEIKHSWYQAFGSNSINLQNLIFKISNSLISDELLSRISVEELLTIRNGTTQNLARLRRNLTQSVAFLQSSYSDSGALNARELDDFINNKFIPDLKYYNSQLIESIQSFVKLSATFVFGALGSAVGLYNGFSGKEIVILSGVSATVGTYVSDLSTLFTKRKNRFRNTYAYFLDIN